MESKNNVDSNEKLDKFEKGQIIESMLEEVGMSKQELIDLLTGVVEVDQSQSISISNSNIIISSETVGKGDTVDASAHRGRVETELSEAMNKQELLSLANKVNAADAFLKAQKMGLTIDEDVAQMMGLESNSKKNSKLSFNHFIVGLKKMSDDQVGRLKKFIGDQIAGFKQNRQQDGDKNGDKTGFGRFVQGMKTAVQKTTGKLKDTLHVLDYNSDMARIKDSVKEVNSANRALRKFESVIRERFPEIGDMQYKQGKVFAKIDGINGIVNLKDFLNSRGDLYHNLAKMIDDAGSAASNMQKNLLFLEKELGNDIDELGFDKSGKLSVTKELEGTKKKVHINDYLDDMDRMTLQKARVKDKAEDDLEHKKALHLDQLHMDQEFSPIEESAEKRDVAVTKEIKNTKDSLVKQDIILDKANLMEARSLMKEGMKDMQEAQKNKDLMENMKKEMMKNRELNK